MDLDATQALDLDEYDETEEEQEDKRDRKQVGQLKVFRTEDFEEKVYDIFEGENVIGRDEGTDVFISRKSLSKTHACIEVSEDLHVVYDDNSKNRTRRDKTILKPQVRYELHHGDMLTLADIKCQYFKGKIEQDNDDDDTGSETGSESMLPEGLPIHGNKDAGKEEDTFAADTDSETDDEKNPVNIKKPYSSDETLAKQDVLECSDQPKPKVPAFMYDSSDDDDDEHVHRTKASTDVKAHMDVSADSGTLAFGLVSPDDVPIIRPTSKKMLEVENTPLTLVYSPDTQDRTPDNPSILPKDKDESTSCASTLIYESESPYHEKSPVKEKQRPIQPEASTKTNSTDLSSDTPIVKKIPEPQREIASCAETLPVEEIESLKETPVRNVEPTMLHGVDKLQETPMNDMPKVGETPSEFSVYLPETQGFSPGNEEASFCEPTQAYLQESPVETPNETPGEMVSDVTSIPDSQEEDGEEGDEKPQSISELKKVLSYDDDSATQAYTWNDSDDPTDDEDDELRFQATQAYPSHIQQPEDKDMEVNDEKVDTKDKDVLQQGADVQDTSPCASPTSPHTDMQQTIAYDVTEMDTQAYVTEKDDLSIDNDKDKDQPVQIEPTLPYNIMDMETQAYEAETEETTSPESDRLGKETPEEPHKKSALIVGDSRSVTIEPTLPYNLEEETQDFDNNEKDTSEQTSKKNADDFPVIEATMPYDIDMETQDFDRKDVEDSATDDEDCLEKKKANMADMMETRAYVEEEAEEKDVNTGPSNVNDDAYGQTQAYGLEDQETSSATDDVIPDSEDVLSQEIPLKIISQDDDTINNNVPDKTPTQHDKQQIDESCNKEEEEAEIIIRPKRRGKGRVTHSSPEEETQQPAMLHKVRSTRGNEAKKSNKVETGVQDTVVDDSEEDQFKIATKTEKVTRERRSTRGKTFKKSKADVTEEEQSVSLSEKRPTRGRRSKKCEIEPARVEDISPHDIEEEQQELASMTEKRPTAGEGSKKTEVEAKVQGVPQHDAEEEQQESASMKEKRPTRGRSKKTEVESKVQGVLQHDAEEEQQESPSMTEKRPTRGRRSKKSEVDTKVQEEQQESASMTEKRPTRGRRSKKSEVDTKVLEEQQESASMSEKRPTGGRLKKAGKAPAIVQGVLPDDHDEEQHESASISEKRQTRGRLKKTEVKPAITQNVLPDANEKERLSSQPVPTEKEDQPESLRGRRSVKTGKEVEKEEKIPPVDTTGEKSKPDSTPVKRQEKMSTRGTRSKKRDEEDVRTENTPSGDNDERLGSTSAVNLDMNAPEHKPSNRPREKKSVVLTKVEDIPPGESEEEQFAIKQKGKGKRAVSLQFDQDSSGIDEELPSMEVIFSGKKTAKGKEKKIGETKEEETPAMLSSKDSSTVETEIDEEKSSETVEVKPFFPRRGRGRVTQSDDSASAIPGTSGSELSEFTQDLMSPLSVAKSISTRKEKKRIREDQTQKKTGMDRSTSQSNSPSPGVSKTRKRGKDSEVFTESTATELSESQSSVTSSVGRKGRGKTAKTTEADDSHFQGASQASDLSESQSSTASSVESKTRGKGRRRTSNPSTLDDTQEQDVQGTPAKKGRTVKREDSPTVVHSPSLRDRKHVTPKIMFTGVSDKQAGKIVTSLGGILVDSVYECTHLITDKVRRTVKFLCGVASGQMIVQPQWLTACKKAKHFIEPVPFIVSDKAAEKQYSFSLQQSLEKAQKGGLLEGYKVHITKNVKPEPSQMKDIIKSAKGEYLPRMPRTMENNVLVVSSEEDQDLCKPALACGIPVYSSELLLTGILRQELELDQNRLFFVEEEGNRKRKESEEGETPVKSANQSSRKRRKK